MHNFNQQDKKKKTSFHQEEIIAIPFVNSPPMMMRVLASRDSTLSVLLGSRPERQAGKCFNIMQASVLLVTSRKTVTDGWTPIRILITQTIHSHVHTPYPHHHK